MSGKLDWEKVNRDKRATFRPSPRALPATTKQINYIQDLMIQKAYKVRIPLSKQGASDTIETLLDLPDRVPSGKREPRLVDDKPKVKEEPIYENLLYGKFSLEAKQANALVYLCQEIDDLDAAFFFDEILEDKLPVRTDDQKETLSSIMGLFDQWRTGQLQESV